MASPSEILDEQIGIEERKGDIVNLEIERNDTNGKAIQNRNFSPNANVHTFQTVSK
jgi:hypothetical protein